MLRALAKHGRRGFASIASPVPPRFLLRFSGLKLLKLQLSI
uniref:Uncharacterized protein n=1 Tax=Brassica oleracea TaxID=3712 RepID=A0A3P6ET67_BRAOL|nr:unnamed protein product [Brassica oleracea]